MKIGSHVSMSGKDMLLGSAKEAVSYGADTFMFYTGAPQNTRRKDISELNIDAAWEYMKAHGETFAAAPEESAAPAKKTRPAAPRAAAEAEPFPWRWNFWQKRSSAP